MAPHTDDNRPLPLADIVREETNDGLHILQFLLDAYTGKLEDFRAADRIEAANILLDMFLDSAQSSRRPPDSALAIVLGGSLTHFKDVVRFQVEAVEGRLEDVTVRERVVLAGKLRNCQRLFDSRVADGRFSSALRRESRGGARIDHFLHNAAGGRIDGATPDDVRNALKVLDS